MTRRAGGGVGGWGLGYNTYELENPHQRFLFVGVPIFSRRDPIFTIFNTAHLGFHSGALRESQCRIQS